MATGRKVTSGPGTSRLQLVGGVLPIAVADFEGASFADSGPATEPAHAAEPEVFLARVVPAANLGAGDAIRVDFRFAIERLRLIQRTAGVTLALGYGREPSAADFDDLAVGALYFDFPIPPSVTITILNMGGVAVADDLVVIGMAGERYRGI